MSSLRTGQTAQEVVLGTVLGLVLFTFLAVPSLAAQGMSVEPKHIQLLGLLCLGILAGTTLIRYASGGFAPNTRTLLVGVIPGAAGVSSIMRGDVLGALTATVGCIAVAYVACFCVQACLRVVRWVIGWFVALSCLLAQLVPAYAVPGRDALPLLIDGRAFGLAAHPNSLGLLSFVLVIASLHERSTRGIPLFVGSFGLLASASYTSQIATGVLVSVLVFVKLCKSGFIRPVPTVLIGMPILASIVLLGNGVDRFRGTLEDMSFTGRTDIWDQLLSIDPGLWGIGRTELLDQVKRVNDVGSAHNSWIQAYIESGLFGIGAAFCWLLMTAVLVWNQRNYMLAATLAAVVVLSLSEGLLFAWPHVFTIALAIACSGRERRKDEPNSRDAAPSTANRSERTNSTLHVRQLSTKKVNLRPTPTAG